MNYSTLFKFYSTIVDFNQGCCTMSICDCVYI